MDRLHFSARARRRARFRRIATRAGIASLVAMALGVPGATAGLDFIERLTSRGEARPASTVEATESIASMKRFQRSSFETRPTPKPTPEAKPTPESSGSISDIIFAAAAEYELDGNYLLSIAECESGLDPNAYNAAGYHGLFQFDSQTWAAYGEGDIFDPEAQARAAAMLIARGESSRWPVCA